MTVPVTVINLINAARAALVDFVWQGLAIAAVLWIALFLLRKRSANLRYLVSCAGLALLALMSIATTLTYWLRHGSSSANSESPLPQVVTMVIAMSGASALSWQAWIETYAIPLWAAGVLAFSIRMVWSCRRVAQLRRKGDEPASDVLEAIARVSNRLGVTRHVRVLISRMVDGPGVIGWLRPVVLLPASTLIGLTPEQLESVLAHELAHIRRHDYLVNIAQMVIETLLFYHPAVWWISSRIRHERELCCDDLAVSISGDAVCYARALTRLERLRTTAAAEPALAIAGGSLAFRVRRLIGDGPKGSGPSRVPGMVTLLFGVVCLTLNMNWAKAQSKPTETKKGEYTMIVREPGTDAPGVHVDAGTSTIMHRRPVEYPEPAMKAGIQGTVLVEVTLTAGGDVADARVLSGPVELRHAALESVLQWHFANSSAGAMRQVTINFRTPTPEELEKVRKEVFYIRDDRPENVGVAHLEAGHVEGVVSSARLLPGFPAGHLPEHETSLLPGHDPSHIMTGELPGHDPSHIMPGEHPGHESYHETYTMSVRVPGADGKYEVKTFTMEAEPGREIAAGRVPTSDTILYSLRIEGMTADMRRQLTEKLALKIGEKLTAEKLQQAEKIVREFDVHLTFDVLGMGGNMMTIRITGPEPSKMF